MCAIAGLVCLEPQCREDEHFAIVGKMCALQHHRGPDDSGIVSLGRVCLGSNRLSVIDLTEAGHMPMSNEDGEWWITYNGEVYNFMVLRQELLDCGHTLRSKTDTEVVLHAFEQYGEKCLDRFVGMFAFAIYDRHTDTVILARDRFGKKPLYYTLHNGHLLFASEVKALMSVCIDLRPNQQRLLEWALYRNVDFGSPETLVEGVFSLPPGHLLKIHQGRMASPCRYYSPEAQVDPARYERFSRQSRHELTAEIEDLLDSSVQARLVSDVPLGTLCSGGLDSSLITAVCARHLSDVTAFHVAVTGYQKIDESQYAQQVTEALGIKLLTYSMEGEAFRRNLPRAIYHSDMPLTHPNSVAFLLVSEFAHQHGVVILLSGEGADELFGGYMQRYRRYRQLLLARRLSAYLPGKIRKAIALAGYACDGVPITGFSEYEGLLAHATAFLDKYAREDLRLRCTDAYQFIADDAERSVLSAMLADVTNYLTPLLRRLDRMSMAASVECRTPFLDHRLVETVVNLPLAFRLRGSTDKWILKEIASRYLPRTIVHRKKVGFPLPLGDYLAPLVQADLFYDGFCLEWLGMHRRGMLEAVANWRQNIHGFFNLLALEIWGRLFFLHQPVEELTERLTQLSGKPTPSCKTIARHRSPQDDL
jgi:asparagine synthase (glutamine-hydrolysing)